MELDEEPWHPLGKHQAEEDLGLKKGLWGKAGFKDAVN